VLAEMYDIGGLKTWLVGEGINGGSVCAAYEFGLVPEGVERGQILEGCMAFVQQGLGDVEHGGLQCIGVEAMRGFVQARLGAEGRDERPGWRYVREGFLFAERWLRANGGLGGSCVEECVGFVEELDLMRLPLKVLQRVVGVSGLVREERLKEIYEGKEGVDDAFEVEYGIDQAYGGEEGGPEKLGYVLRHIAVHGELTEQRLAVADAQKRRVLVFNVVTGECVFSVGSCTENTHSHLEGEAAGNFLEPMGAAFNVGGELYVSD
jgi:hypothetical protein